MSYKIVADSAANLYSLEKSPFAYVPLKVHCEGKEFIDNAEQSPDPMIELLRRTKERSFTSCPNMQEWYESFGDAQEIYAVAITAGLSGSYSAAEQAKAEYLETHPQAKIHIINSLSAGPEMALIVERLATLKESGASFEETVKEIQTYTTKTRLAFCLKSLNNLARNGRISPAKAKLVGTLGIRIVGRASEEGTLQQQSLCRGEPKALQGILAEMIGNGFEGGKVRIHHCHNEQAAQKLKDLLLTHAPTAEIELLPCGVLCSYYAEEGGIFIGYET